MNIDHHYSFWQRWYRCIVCQKHTIHLSFCLLQIIQVTHILGTNISIRIRIFFFLQIMILLILHCHLLQFTSLTAAYINVMSSYIFLERILLCFLGKIFKFRFWRMLTVYFHNQNGCWLYIFSSKLTGPQMYHFPIIFLQPKKFRSNDSHKYTS